MKDAAAQLPAAPDRARLEAAPRRAPYLKSIRMTSFGAFKDKVVGPFSPHLNVSSAVQPLTSSSVSWLL